MKCKFFLSLFLLLRGTRTRCRELKEMTMQNNKRSLFSNNSFLWNSFFFFFLKNVQNRMSYELDGWVFAHARDHYMFMYWILIPT